MNFNRPITFSNYNGKKRFLKISGRAIFDNDLKMIGTLTSSEARNRLWIKNKLGMETLTAEVPEEGGNITFAGRKLNSKVKPILDGDKIKFVISLTGKGDIKENNTNLDLRNQKYLKEVEQALNKDVQKNVTKTISKVQEELKVDIFGLGETIHRKYPKRWKEIKDNWNEDFTKADIVVNVNLKVEEVGVTGPPLQLRESVIKK